MVHHTPFFCSFNNCSTDLYRTHHRACTKLLSVWCCANPTKGSLFVPIYLPLLVESPFIGTLITFVTLCCKKAVCINCVSLEESVGVFVLISGCIDRFCFCRGMVFLILRSLSPWCGVPVWNTSRTKSRTGMSVSRSSLPKKTPWSGAQHFIEQLWNWGGGWGRKEGRKGVLCFFLLYYSLQLVLLVCSFLCTVSICVQYLNLVFNALFLYFACYVYIYFFTVFFLCLSLPIV